MKRWTVYLTILAALAILALPAVAGKRSGTGGGGAMAIITFAGGDTARTSTPELGDEVWFDVDPVRVKDRDLGHLWVSNVCFQDGVPVLRQDQGVEYTSYREGLSGAFVLTGPAWLSGGASCNAAVYIFGDGPLAGASMTYSVSG